jgi:hypothetical protein
METSLRYILFSSCRVPLVYLRPPKRPYSQGAHTVYQPVSLANKSTASDQLPECVVEMGGFEPPTSRVQGGRSPTELHPHGVRPVRRFEPERPTDRQGGGPAWNRTGDLSLIRTAL